MKKHSPFRIVAWFIRFFIFFISAGFSALAFYGGYFMTSWYPTFTDLRMGGIMMVLSFVLFVFSFLIFKKKNFSSFILIIVVTLLDYGAFIYNEGFGHEADEYVFTFLITLIILYSIGKILERKA